MSLLLKALQNAARNREAGAAGSEVAAGAEQRAGSGDLSLEPLQPTGRAGARSASFSTDELGAERAAPASGAQQQAQTVLRAGARTERPAPRQPGFFDWLARRPLVAFSTAAGLFAVGYGVYLYLQITNPGLFASGPSRPIAPAPVATAPKPPEPTVVPPAALPPPPTPAVDGPRAAGAMASAPPASATPEATTLPPAPASIVPPAPPIAPAPQVGSIASAPSGAAPTAPAPLGSASPLRAPAPPAAPTERPATSVASAAAPSTGSVTPAPPPAARAAVPPSAATSGPIVSVAPSAASPVAEPSSPRARAAAKPAAAPPARDVQAPAPQVATIDTSVLTGYQALEKGQAAEAERAYRQALAGDPRSTDAMLGLAAALAQQQKGDAATQMYLRVLENDPRNAHAQAGLLNLAGRADPVAAEARLKQLIARDPSAFLYFTLGNLYAEQGQWAAAQSAYFQAHNLSPDNPDYAFNLAVGLEHLSQPRIALDYYRRAVALAQARGHAQFELARVEGRIRSLEAALALRP